MTTITEPTQPRDVVRFTVDIDVYDLTDDTQNKLPRIISESVQYALGDEAVIEVAEMEVAKPTPSFSPTVAYVVVQGQIVGNPEAGYEHSYYSDMEQKPSREKAVSHGWETYEHDDWLILKLVDGKAAALSWMDEERDDADELAEVARQIGLEVAR